MYIQAFYFNAVNMFLWSLVKLKGMDHHFPNYDNVILFSSVFNCLVIVNEYCIFNCILSEKNVSLFVFFRYKKLSFACLRRIRRVYKNMYKYYDSSTKVYFSRCCWDTINILSRIIVNTITEVFFLSLRVGRYIFYVWVNLS
jgi:hypothetical protein